MIDHSIAQIEAGANVIQLFDSWAGVLSEQEFFDYSIIPSQKITAAIKAKYPHIPVIGFPRMAGSKMEQYAKLTGVDAVSFDGSVSLEFAANDFNKLYSFEKGISQGRQGEVYDKVHETQADAGKTLNQASIAVMQGNLDNIMLAEDKNAAVAQTKKILDNFSGKPFVFNLAHGILPHTPIENVQAVCDEIQNYY